MFLFVFVLLIVFNIFDLFIRLEGLFFVVKNDGMCLVVYLWVNIMGFGNVVGYFMRVFNIF